MISLACCASFFENPEAFVVNIQRTAVIQHMYECGALMMAEFFSKVLEPIAPGMTAYCRPDEVKAQLGLPFDIESQEARLTEIFNPLRKLFEHAQLQLLIGDGDLCSVFDAMSAAVSASSDAVVFLPCLDDKTFAVCAWGHRWICLDSHARSVSGKNRATTSLLCSGLTEMSLRDTLCELLLRGGDEAAYKRASTGGLWSLVLKPGARFCAE